MNQFEKCENIMIVFNRDYIDKATDIYDTLSLKYPHKTVFLYQVKGIICPLKIKNTFDGYVIIGPNCLLHKLTDKITLEIDHCILKDKEGNILELTENTQTPPSILYQYTHDIKHIFSDQYCPKCDVVTDKKIFNLYRSYLGKTLTEINRDFIPVDQHIDESEITRFYMRENINGKYFNDKTVFAVVFTHTYYENVANNVYKLLKQYKTNVFKLFLKDVSYERLISIDSVDCIVLIDCPMFNCDIELHIPVISPFSLCRGIDKKWIGENYGVNKTEVFMDTNEEISRERALEIKNSEITQIMAKKTFQGVTYRKEEEDNEIHKGRSGIADEYKNIN